MPEDGDLPRRIVEAKRTARLVRAVTIGTGPFWPEYPYHGALRPCPFCGDIYRRHAGFADHRDNCEEGPHPGANPVR